MEGRELFENEYNAFVGELLIWENAFIVAILLEMNW